MIDNYEVVVIGCGASGIAAARTFYEKGIKCLILEGRDRYGGRVFPQTLKSTNNPTSSSLSLSTPSPSVSDITANSEVEVEIEIQLGANWIHGLNSERNPMKALADKLLLKLHQTSSDDEPGDDVLLFDKYSSQATTAVNVGYENDDSNSKEDNQSHSQRGFQVVSHSDYQAALTRYNWIRDHLADVIPTEVLLPSSEVITSPTAASLLLSSNKKEISLQTAFELTLVQSEFIFGRCTPLHHRIITWILDRISIDLAVNLNQIPVSEYTGTESDGADGEAVVIGGYFQIIRHLFEEYPLQVKFNHIVNNITTIIDCHNKDVDKSGDSKYKNYENKDDDNSTDCISSSVDDILSNAHIENSINHKNEKDIHIEKKVLIECSSGYKVYAKHCLVTVPVGVLLHESDDGIGTIRFQTSTTTTTTTTDVDNNSNSIKHSNNGDDGSVVCKYSSSSQERMHRNTDSTFCTTTIIVVECPAIIQKVCNRYKMGLMNLVWLWFPYKFWLLSNNGNHSNGSNVEINIPHNISCNGTDTTIDKSINHPDNNIIDSTTNSHYNFFGAARSSVDDVGFSTFLAPPMYDKHTGQPQAVLMCQVVGELAKKIETLSNDEVSTICMETLQNMFSAYIKNSNIDSCDDNSNTTNSDSDNIYNSNNNNNNSNNNNAKTSSSSSSFLSSSSSAIAFTVPAPLRCSVSRWSSDPFARGSWSYVPIDSSSGSISNYCATIHNNSGGVSNNINEDSHNITLNNDNVCNDNNNSFNNIGSGIGNMINSVNKSNIDSSLSADSVGDDRYNTDRKTTISENIQSFEFVSGSKSSSNNNNNNNNNKSSNSNSNNKVNDNNAGSNSRISNNSNNKTNHNRYDGSVISYAGEAMSVEYRGTVHGAYLSGQSVANDIILQLMSSSR